jgi:aspartyl-tRNA(Asn)/glutamyl-tRNA(Gln) amidotransferase subunit A
LSQDHIGPLCRTALDAALVLEGIAGYDPLDTGSVDWPTEKYSGGLQSSVKSLRIGAVRTYFYDQLDPEIRSSVAAAEGVLQKLTTGIRDAELPPFRTLTVTGPEAYAFHKPYFTKTPELYQEQTRQRLQYAALTTAAEYAEARHELDWLRREVASAFSAVDLLITPATPIMPVKIEDAAAVDASPAGLLLRNTRPFSYFGLPTVSIPCGFSTGGLPIGIQIVGPRFGESRVLAFAHAFQQVTKWHLRQPSLK